MNWEVVFLRLFIRMLWNMSFGRTMSNFNEKKSIVSDLEK